MELLVCVKNVGISLDVYDFGGLRFGNLSEEIICYVVVNGCNLNWEDIWGDFYLF